MNRNLQPGIHPDADQLSVFIEGAATAREQERMLAHLGECAECRKAAFLMQPHEEIERTTATPVKGWIWRRLLPVGLPAAALACGLIAVLVYIRPHGGAPSVPQQVASVRQQEIEPPGPGTTVAPTTNSDRVARSESPKNISAPNATATDTSPQKKHVASDLNLPASKNEHAPPNVAPHTMAAAPSISAPVADAATVSGGIVSGTVSDLPLNGRNVMDLQQFEPAGTKGAASQNSLAGKKELPGLEIERASGKDETFAGVSGRITDRTGAIIAGATVTLRDATGKTRQMTTSADGSFHLTELPAGRYELTATASGFKTNKQSVELKPSELAMLQPVLDVGTASEAVTVEAGAQLVQTEDAALSQNVDARVFRGNGNGLPQNAYTRVFGGNGDGQSVWHGKRFLSLDSTGILFLSRNGGKKWKKIRPQWTGKAVRIELTPAYRSEAPPKPKNETLGQASEVAVFLLTTDAGTVWTSRDGAHWHQQ